MPENYNAPFLDESEHAILDHTGIPGVGAGGGGGAVFDSFIYLAVAGVPVNADTNVNGQELILAAEGTGTDLSWDGTSGQLSFTEHGIYKVSVIGRWSINTGETGSRSIDANLVAAGDFALPAVVALLPLHTRDYIGDITTDVNPELYQTVTSVGEVGAGAILEFSARNHDSVNDVTLAQWIVVAARIA